MSKAQVTILRQETQVKEKEGPVWPRVEEKEGWSYFQGDGVQASDEIRAVVIRSGVNRIHQDIREILKQSCSYY